MLQLLNDIENQGVIEDESIDVFMKVLMLMVMRFYIQLLNLITV
jgi:hypothetical protein